MALTDDQMILVRELVAEPDDSNGWTDERINSLGPAALSADGTYDIRVYVALVWEAKAAEAVGLVDVSESGSSRSMGQIHAHAVKMAERYKPAADDNTGISAGRTRIGKIVRE